MAPKQPDIANGIKAELFILAHEILHELIRIEPKCISFDNGGDPLPSILTTTHTGKFLSGLLARIDHIRTNYLGE